MTVGEQALAWVDAHLEVELTDWQRRTLVALYDRPGEPGALART